MLSRRTWLAIAIALALFAIWLSFQHQSIVYSERKVDGVLFQSKVECGTGVGMVFFGQFDPSLPGTATRSDCLRYGHTRIAELAGLLLMAATLAWVGVRYGKEPPRPIRLELPDLPKGGAGVEGRRPTTQDTDHSRH